MNDKKFRGVIKLDVRDSTPDWGFEEADKNQVLPLDDRSARELLAVERPSEEPVRERYLYYAGTSPVPEGVAGNTRGRSYKIIANVESTGPNCSGVIFAHGSRFGGHPLFIKDKKLYYAYNFLGIKPEQQFAFGELKPGRYTLGMEFNRDKAGKFGLCVGRDSGDAVSELSKTPGDFKGGTIEVVGVTVEKKQYLDLEKVAAMALAND